MAIDETLLKREEAAVYALRSLYRRFGYTQFKMSKFEEYDLYVRNKDFLVSDGIITFTDTNGRLKALKPDVTLSIINNSKDADGVQKLYYNENVYRISGSTHTFKEIMQTGLECVGNIGLFEVAEVLNLAVKSLETIDRNTCLELSHVGLIEAAFDELGLSQELRKNVISFIRAKNTDDLKIFCNKNNIDAEKLTVFSRNFTSPSEAFATVKSAFCSQNVLDRLNEFETLYNVLSSLNSSVRIIVDFSCIGTMSYYSGVVFKGYVQNIPDAVLSGGQYDKLMRKLHRTAGAIGFAVYLDELGRNVREPSEYDVDTVLLYGDNIEVALKLAEELSNDSTSVLALKEIPRNLRYRRLLKITEEGTVRVDGND